MECCENCFSEKEISKFIRETGHSGNCNYCKCNNVQVLSLKKVGDFIKKGLKRAYEELEEGTGAMWDSDERNYIDKYGDMAGQSIYEILIEEYNIFSNYFESEDAKKLLKDIFEESKVPWRDVTKGASNEFEDIYDSRYAIRSDLYGVEIVNEHIAWKNFVYTTKYFNRFFDTNPNCEKREELLKSLSSMLKYLEEYIEKDTILYRVRQMEIENINTMDNNSFYKEISPAPNNYSKNNRMSPKGISYMYLGDNILTCCLETRLEENRKALVGKFKPKKRLKIINLSKEIFIPSKSMFSDSYDHSDNWINDFVADFEKEISKPILQNENELEYVPTQILSEYIRSCGFDGIKFESSLAKGTFNYTLFCGPDRYLSMDELGSNLDNFQELKSFLRWLTLDSVKYIQYDNNKISVLFEKNIGEFIDTIFNPRHCCLEFSDIDEISTELRALQEEIKKNCILPEVDFNIVKVLSKYTDKYRRGNKVFFIATSDTYDGIGVGYGVNGNRETYVDIRFEKKNVQSLMDLLKI